MEQALVQNDFHFGPAEYLNLEPKQENKTQNPQDIRESSCSIQVYLALLCQMEGI